MTDTDDAVVAEAVDALETFELTEYEARCFVALSRIGQGTAKEVSEVADVPQARVYDCMDALAERGLVDVQQSSPRRFRAVDPEAAVAALDRRCQRHLDRLSELLPRLEAPVERNTDGDVWTTEGGDDVSARAADLIAEASGQVLLALAAEDLLTDDLRAELADAVERGVEVTIGSPSEDLRAALADALPDATVVETWTWWETHPVQPGAVTCVTMVDSNALLVSADVAASLPGVREHRAVWTDSESAPIVGLLQPLLARAIAGPDGA
jgi:sugar-specific transcriptional regulator TrmB